MIKYFLVVLLCFSFLSAADTLNIEGKIIISKRFSGPNEDAKRLDLTSLHLIQEGKSNAIIDGVTYSKVYDSRTRKISDNGGELSILDKSKIRYKSNYQNIDTLLVADIKQGWSGGTKSIHVTPSEYESKLKDAWSKVINQFVTLFGFKFKHSKTSTIKYSLQFKGLSCERLGKFYVDCAEVVQVKANIDFDMLEVFPTSTDNSSLSLKAAIPEAMTIIDEVMASISDSSSYQFSAFTRIIQNIRFLLPSSFNAVATTNSLEKVQQTMLAEMIKGFRLNDISGKEARQFLTDLKVDLAKINSQLD